MKTQNLFDPTELELIDCALDWYLRDTVKAYRQHVISESDLRETLNESTAIAEKISIALSGSPPVRTPFTDVRRAIG